MAIVLNTDESINIQENHSWRIISALLVVLSSRNTTAADPLRLGGHTRIVGGSSSIGRRRRPGFPVNELASTQNRKLEYPPPDKQITFARRLSYDLPSPGEKVAPQYKADGLAWTFTQGASKRPRTLWSQAVYVERTRLHRTGESLRAYPQWRITRPPRISI